jgi:hypothetical protein
MPRATVAPPVRLELPDRPDGRWPVASRPPTLLALVGLVTALSVAAVPGGAQFLLAPSGRLIGMTPAALAGSPFDSYSLPGLVLLVVLGVGTLPVVYGLWTRRPWAWYGAVATGGALAVWVLVEGAVIGYWRRVQLPHLLQALAILALAFAPSVRTALLGSGDGDD